MNKTITLTTRALLLVIIIYSLFLAFNKPEEVVKTPELNFGGPNYFMNSISQCSNTVSVSEQFSCIYKLAEETRMEADTMAQKLISQASIRFNEIVIRNTGPAPFVYGGSDFLKDLPEQVKKAQVAKDEYINSVCNLTSMTIYGGSGMDLEQNACRYYFTNEYLQILKSLESGLTVIE